MDTEGITAIVVTVLIFTVIGVLVIWLQKKGVATTYELPRSVKDYHNDRRSLGYWLRQGHKDFPR